MAEPDECGFSRKVSVDEFKNDYQRLKLGNGASWCREEGSLGKQFNVVREKEKGKIVNIKLAGFKKNPIKKSVRKDIKDAIEKERCRVLFISKVEVDHKDGRRDDYSNFELDKQSLEHFQPLSSPVNKAKRSHCKKCRETNKRFDATNLGYKRGYWAGDEDYNGSCVGCYWYDVRAFNHNI